MGIYDLGPEDISQGTAGASSSMWEHLTQAYDQQYRVDSPYSQEAEIHDRWLDTLTRYEKETGKPHGLRLDLSAFDTYARTSLGQEPSRWQQGLGFDGFTVTPELQRDIDQFRKVNEEIKAMGRPDMRSFEDVLQEVVQMQRGVEQETQRLGESADFSDSVASFLGSVAGSFNLRDPLTIGTLGLGGFGRTIALRLATEGAVQAGLTGVTTEFGVNPARERAGLPERNVVPEMLGAFVLGAGIRGVAEGGGVLSRRLRERAAPSIDLDFEDTQLRQMLGQMPQTPEVRAAGSILEDSAQLRKLSPYGDTPTGLLRFQQDLEGVARVLGGEPMTAVGRVLEPLPFEYIQKLDDFKIVKEQAPEIYRAMEEAKAKVAEIDERINGINNQLDATTLPDAVRLVDPEAATKLDELAAVVTDMKQPEPVRTAAEIRAQEIIKRVGEEKIAKALNDAEITPRKEVQRLGRERYAANRKLREATKAVEARRNVIRAFQEKMLGRGELAAPNVMAAPRREPPRGVVGPSLRHDTVRQHTEALDLTEKMIPDEALARAVAPPTSEGLYDIGLEAPVPGDFRLPVERADGSVETLSVKEIFDDFQEDVKLEEAVRSCAL